MKAMECRRTKRRESGRARARASAVGASFAASIAASSGRGSFTVMRASFQAKQRAGGVSLFRAPLRGRGCGGAGGRIAAARLARLIARARRRTHLARPFPPGCFSRPPAIAFCRKAERRPPGSRLSLLSFYTIPPNVKPIREHKMKISEIFHQMTVELRAGATPCTLLRHPGPRLPCSGAGTGGRAARRARPARSLRPGEPGPAADGLAARRCVRQFRPDGKHPRPTAPRPPPHRP